MSKKHSTEDLQKKFRDLLSDKGSLIVTDDGQAFYNTKEGAAHAAAYCATSKTKSQVIKAAKSDAPTKDNKKKSSK